jgi:Rrf2 family transcriptional regulator, nitric oxide-sensitive transcriptional repressor
MRLTKHTDYALRVLLYAGTWPDRLVSTEEISQAYGISNNHLIKIVNKLGKLGVLEVKRGRLGGVRLARPPEDINLGALVRATEPDFHMVECFDSATNTCPIVRGCTLIRPLHEARAAFLAVLDGYTLADMLGPQHMPRYRRLFQALAG